MKVQDIVNCNLLFSLSIIIELDLWHCWNNPSNMPIQPKMISFHYFLFRLDTNTLLSHSSKCWTGDSSKNASIENGNLPNLPFGKGNLVPSN